MTDLTVPLVLVEAAFLAAVAAERERLPEGWRPAG